MTPMILIVDSWAWLATTDDTKSADIVFSYLENKENKIYTTVLNLYEIYYRVKEKSNEVEANQFIESIRTKAIILNIDETLALLAGRIHLKEKLSAVDAFVYATALKLDGNILTGDPHFKGKERVIFID